MKRILLFIGVLSVFSFSSCSGNSTGEDFSISSLSDLRGHTVSSISGSLHEMYVQDNIPEAEMKSLNSVPEILMSISTGKIEYGVIDQAGLVAVDLKDKGCAIVLETDEISGAFGFGLNYTNRQLADSCNAFLAQIRNNGIYDDIVERWTKNPENSVMPEVVVPKDGDVLEIAVFSANFPFSFVSGGKICGLEPEILLRFGEYIGRPVHFTGYEFPSLMPALSAGRAEMITGSITITEERAKNVLFTDPFYHSNTIVLTRAQKVVEKKGFVESVIDSFNSNLIQEDRWKMLLQGLRETIRISFFSILLGTIIGILICWMSMSKVFLLRLFSKIYLEVLRGIPMLVFLMIMFYVVLASSPLTATGVAIIAFAMVFGAFVSVIFQNGVTSIDRGQTEAGLALGFTKLQTFFLVILPQAVKRIIPVYKNEAVSLIKDTSIVGYIAIQDLTKMGDLIRNRTFDAFFPFIVVSIIYFLLAWIFGKLLDAVNK